MDDEYVINLTNKKNAEKRRQEIRIRKEEERRKRKRRRHAIVTLCGLIVFILLICAIGLLSPNFNIQTVEVENNEKISTEEILQLARIETETNIFQLVKKELIGRIKTNPYIGDVIIEKLYPDGIKINIREREQEYCLLVMDQYIYIDEEGYLLEESMTNNSRLIVIDGVEFKHQYQLGDQLDEKYLESINFFKQVFAMAEEEDFLSQITSINIGDSENYYFEMEDLNQGVYFGNSKSINTKMMYISSILKENKELAGDVYVDGDFDDGFKAYFRKEV